MPQVDHEEHMYGPESKQAEEAVQFVDESIHKMVRDDRLAETAGELYFSERPWHDRCRYGSSIAHARGHRYQ